MKPRPHLASRFVPPLSRVLCSSLCSNACRFLCSILLLAIALASPGSAQPPPPAATAAFNSYAALVEARLIRQHRTRASFLAEPAFNPASEQRLLDGAIPADGIPVAAGRANPILIEPLTPATSIPGALLHHWRGTVFVPGATAAGFDRLLRDVDHYPVRFAPQVLAAHVLARNRDHLQATLRVRQQHALTVVLDSTLDVTFGELDPLARYSSSRSLQISEIAAAGSSREHVLTPAEQHGFLWRSNTYWSYEERAGGLWLQVESVSLSRSIPTGLGWALRPFVESVPRETLEFALHSAAAALPRQPPPRLPSPREPPPRQPRPAQTPAAAHPYLNQPGERAR